MLRDSAFLLSGRFIVDYYSNHEGGNNIFTLIEQYSRNLKKKNK